MFVVCLLVLVYVMCLCCDDLLLRLIVMILRLPPRLPVLRRTRFQKIAARQTWKASHAQACQITHHNKHNNSMSCCLDTGQFDEVSNRVPLRSHRVRTCVDWDRCHPIHGRVRKLFVLSVSMIRPMRAHRWKEMGDSGCCYTAGTPAAAKRAGKCRGGVAAVSWRWWDVCPAALWTVGVKSYFNVMR